MNTLVVFAIVLLTAVLLSEYASRSILSTFVLFLLAGFLAGQGVLDVIKLQTGDQEVKFIAEIALFATLFTDGMRTGYRDLRSAWHLPGRALLLGLPVTLIITALFAHWVAGLNWPVSFLIGAVLSPTDPVFASAIVGREEVPLRLRRLLNVESGLNDGLALPVVLILLEVVGAEQVNTLSLFLELGLGVVIGIAITWAAIQLERTSFLEAVDVYEPIFAFAVGLLVYAATAISHGNEFLAAFAAGATMSTMSEKLREEFHEFGEILAELLKLGALLLFGALVTPSFFSDLSIWDYVFTFLVLFVARPVAIGIALIGSRITWQEWVSAAWFGPKGFASVVYGILILESGADRSNHLFHLIAIVIAVSIVLHSSTDVVMAGWLKRNLSQAEAGDSTLSSTDENQS